MPPQVQPKPFRAAVDTNVLMDLALPRETAHDAVELMRTRIAQGCEFVVTPRVFEELDFIAEHGDEIRERELAGAALDRMVADWGFMPLDFSGAGHDIAEIAAEHIIGAGLLPAREYNDAVIVAEAAQANSGLLLTSDNHMLVIAAPRLHLILDSLGLGRPLIVSPARIVRDFSPRQ